MSHVVDYWTSEKKKDIGYLASDFALRYVNRMEDPSGSYHGDLEILENHTYDNYDQALEAAKKIAKKEESIAILRFHSTIAFRKNQPNKC